MESIQPNADKLEARKPIRLSAKDALLSVTESGAEPRVVPTGADKLPASFAGAVELAPRSPDPLYRAASYQAHQPGIPRLS